MSEYAWHFTRAAQYVRNRQGKDLSEWERKRCREMWLMLRERGAYLIGFMASSPDQKEPW